MSSTKLIVLKSKELIYTAILLALVIVFVIILITMFRGKDSDDTSGSARSIATSAQTDPSPKLDEIHYTPGTYSSSLVLGETLCPSWSLWMRTTSQMCHSNRWMRL